LGKALQAVLEARTTHISTGVLNRQMREWIAAHPPPVRKGRRPKIHYAVQAGSTPPTFVLFVSGGELGADYLRYLENRLRDSYDFVGNPVRFVTRAKSRRDR
jgi:GTP-binding protein